MTTDYPGTLDRRDFVVRGRLWRKSNPGLDPEVQQMLVQRLMQARRVLSGRRSAEDWELAREQVDDAKRALGERGPVWWNDGAPDFNWKTAVNTP